MVVRTILAGAFTASLLLTGAGVALAQEPNNCGDATSALNNAEAKHRDAVEADRKAEEAKEADRAFDRAARELDRARDRQKAAFDVVHAEGHKATEDELRELRSADRNLDQAQRERDRTRKEADKENADQLQRRANDTDADAIQRDVDAAREDVTRLCGPIVLPTTPPPPPPVDNGGSVDNDNGSANVSQGIDTGGL